MSEWKKYKLSEFIEINPKVTLKSGIQHSFVEMKDLNESQKYVFPSQFKDIKGGARFQNSDTLFARITPCLQNGKICQVQGLKNSLGFGSTEFLVFRGKDGISYTDFIYYLSRYEVVRKFAEQNMIGTSGRQRVSKDAFANLELFLPDLPTQTAIAEILSSIDDKIELNNKINQELETLAQTLFKQWFIDFEFPNDNGEPYKSSGGEMANSEIGDIPKGWEVLKFKEIVSKYIDNRGKTPPIEKIGIPLIEVKHMVDNGIFPTLKTDKYLSEEVYDSFLRAHLQERDILMSTVGTIGRLNIVSSHQKYAIAQNVLGIRFKHDFVTQLYMFCLMRTKMFNDEIKSRLIETVQSSIKRGDLEKIPVLVPTLSTILKFDILIDDLFGQIKTFTLETLELIKLRDTLLPKLMLGELEINEISK